LLKIIFTPIAIRIHPKILLKVFWILLKNTCIFPCVKSRETKINQRIVSAISMRAISKSICVGVDGLKIKVKRLKKNKVAFGLRTFVKNPILKA